MKQSAHQELSDHLKSMLEKSAFARETVEVAAECPACNGEGFTQSGTEFVICQTCKGERMIVCKTNKY